MKKEQEMEQIDYENEAKELEERLRTSIRAGQVAKSNSYGDTGGLW